LYVRKIFLISKLALVLLLGYVAVKAVIVPQRPGEIFAPSPAVGSEKATEGKKAGLRQNQEEDYQAIIEKNIFGLTDSSLTINKPSNGCDDDGLIRSAEQELGLILLGTVCGSEAVSRAIIKDTKSNKIGLYRTNETVANAAIESIEEDSVILANNGQRMILRLYTAQHGSNSAEPRHGSPNENVQKKIESIKSNVSVQSASSDEVTKIDAMQELFKKAVIEPYSVAGQVEGLKITGLKNIPLAGELGLKDGDIVCSVNGQHLISQQKAFQVFQKARMQSAINIELLREGQTKNLSFNLR
jgi:type II secretion system protein C